MPISLNDPSDAGATALASPTLGDPIIYAHLVGLAGHYHLYITRLDPESLFAGGYEVS